MAIVSNATPLIALDALVVDTETTGLDPAKAHVVEIGAVPLKQGKLDEAAALRRLINPGVPIPPVATTIHGIDDAAVAAEPDFSAVWPQFASVISGAVLIGHTIGFDLAVLKRECARAGLPWTPPRTLDTALLAQVAEPHLGGYTLEHLASWLGVTVEGRHSALGDAVLTAHIFLALIPKLRDGNIRTLGGSRTSLPCADHRARRTASRRLGGSGYGAHGARGKLRAHRCLSLPPSRPRCDERTGARRRGGRFARRSAQTHGGRENFFGSGERQGRRRAAARCRYRHRHRARCAARARRARRRRARPHGRHHRQQTAGRGAGRRLCLPRHRPHEPAQISSSGGGKRSWRDLRHRHLARPAAPARGGSGGAGRRHRSGRRRAGSGRGLGAAAASGGWVAG